MNMCANALAKLLNMPANRIDAILYHSQGVTVDTALRLARYFSTTPEFGLELQANFDLRTTQAEIGSELEREITPS